MKFQYQATASAIIDHIMYYESDTSRLIPPHYRAGALTALRLALAAVRMAAAAERGQEGMLT